MDTLAYPTVRVELPPLLSSAETLIDSSHVRCAVFVSQFSMGGHRELWWIEEDDGGRRKVTVTFQSPLPALNKGRSPGETPEDHRKNETYYSHYWPDDPHDYDGSKRGFLQRRNNARNTFADRKLGVKGGLVGILDKLRDHPELGPSPPPFDLKPPGAFDPPAPVPEGTGRTVPVAPARGAAVMGGQAPVAPKPLSKASSSSAARVGRAVRQATQHCPDLLQPGAKFQRKGQTYEIDCHDRMQSTTVKQYYHLKQDGKPLNSSYERNSHWVVLEQPTRPTEESLLGFVSSVLDGETMKLWDNEKVRLPRN